VFHPATCMPMLIVVINIVAHPCISHRFNPSQHRRVLMVECLLTLTQIPWAPWFVMRLASTNSLPTLEVARLHSTLPRVLMGVGLDGYRYGIPWECHI
jgi:hypothetical protein